MVESLGLTRSLYIRGYNREQVVELFHFIGWMIRLPEMLEYRLVEAVKRVEEEFKMPYINTVEQYGIKQGIEQGIEQGRREAEEQAAEEQLKNTRRIACGMLAVEGLNDERIAEITGLAVEEVTQLRLEKKH